MCVCVCLVEQLFMLLSYVIMFLPLSKILNYIEELEMRLTTLGLTC